MKILPLFEPNILTIPEDSMVFSLVQKDTQQYYKLIMENYINYMVFRDPVYMDVFLRFEDYWNWAGFQGFISSFIPREIIQHIDKPVEIVKNMIDNDYCAMCFLDRFFIAFYPQYQQYHSSHTSMIYGYDEQEERLYCKDYQNNAFVKYEMTFTEFENSLKNYDIFLNRGIGLFGLKVNNNIVHEVDYSKFYSELVKLKYSRKVDENTYGIDVFDTISNWLNEAEQKGKANLYSWYDVANYLKSSAALMEDRVKFLKMSLPEASYQSLDQSIKKLLQTTNLFFLKVVKSNMKNDNSHENLLKRHELLKDIVKPYIDVVDELLLLLEDIFLINKQVYGSIK